MKNTDSLQALINSTTDKMLDEWTAEAIRTGRDIQDFIGEQLDILEVSEPEVCAAVGTRNLHRVMGIAA